jgi:hypothetical protein
MLGNTLGTWGTCWEPIGNFMGTIKIQNPNAPSKEKEKTQNPWLCIA